LNAEAPSKEGAFFGARGETAELRGIRARDKRANMPHALSPAYAANLRHEAMSPRGLTAGHMPKTASWRDGRCGQVAA